MKRFARFLLSMFAGLLFTFPAMMCGVGIANNFKIGVMLYIGALIVYTKLVEEMNKRG